MHTIKLLRAIYTVAVLGFLSGCTSFAPVYGDRASAAANSARFNFTAPSSRLEQVILNRLKVAFPGVAGPEDPTLDIDATATSLPSSLSTAFAVARPVNIRVQAVVTISRDTEQVLQETRFADTAYQGGKVTPTDLFSKAEAEEGAAEAVADALRIAILAKMLGPAAVR